MAISIVLSAGSWLLIALWLVLYILGRHFRNPAFLVASALLGSVFALDVITSSYVIGGVILLVNIYVFYSTLYVGGETD